MRNVTRIFHTRYILIHKPRTGRELRYLREKERHTDIRVMVETPVLHEIKPQIGRTFSKVSLTLDQNCIWADTIQLTLYLLPCETLKIGLKE